MAGDREARIRARAHELWEKEGRPEGEEKRHWEHAAREIEREDAGSKTTAKRAPGKTTAKPKAAAGAKKSASASAGGPSKRGRKAT
jgi:Protein of unknown function (DUF2934)